MEISIIVFYGGIKIDSIDWSDGSMPYSPESLQAFVEARRPARSARRTPPCSPISAARSNQHPPGSEPFPQGKGSAPSRMRWPPLRNTGPT
ncbi:hypothetical protein EN855_033560, partial [Mesorhizobium sp. M1C.F.Ca.ET.212.01.1.1]